MDWTLIIDLTFIVLLITHIFYVRSLNRALKKAEIKFFTDKDGNTVAYYERELKDKIATVSGADIHQVLDRINEKRKI